MARRRWRTVIVRPRKNSLLHLWDQCAILTQKTEGKDVRASMAYQFTGVDIDDMIYGECDTVISGR